MLGWRSVSISRVGLVLYGIVIWGCSRPVQGPSAELALRSKPTASVRLLITGDIAGTIEPCGCVKDQLGGLDRFAFAVLNSRRQNQTLFLEAGALLFPRASDEPNERDELLLRAETLAKVMHSLGLLAWSPGKADCALGEPVLLELTNQLGAKPLQSCASSGNSTFEQDNYLVTNVAGINVGVFAMGSTWTRESTGPGELETKLRAASSALESKGAKLKIAVLNGAPEQAAKLASHLT